MDRYLHGATLEETVATGVYCLVTGKRRDSNVYFVQSGGTWVLVDTAWRGRAELIRSAAETLFGVGTRLRAIVLTHVHPDHAGSACELARRSPGPLTAPRSSRTVALLTANSVRKPGDAQEALRCSPQAQARPSPPPAKAPGQALHEEAPR